MNTIAICINNDGNCKCLYTEHIDLRQLGELHITRATNIEFNHQTMLWEVINENHQRLYTHAYRSECLAWEQRHFNQ